MAAEGGDRGDEPGAGCTSFAAVSGSPATAPGGLIGVDVGGTKCAGGILALEENRILATSVQPTLPQRGGLAVLNDVAKLVVALCAKAERLGIRPLAVGVGVAELVSRDGVILSEATIGWKGLPIRELLSREVSLPVAVDADVRAAARAEAALGSGSGLGSFLYVTLGTGISSCLVIDGVPYLGAGGLTGTFASQRVTIANDQGELVTGPPLEAFASGPAIASRMRAVIQDYSGSAADVVTLAGQGNDLAASILQTAGRAVGGAVAQLVNVLDPNLVVVGGGLGLIGGVFRESLEQSLREHIWSELNRGIPLVSARLGVDAGWIGAALTARMLIRALDRNEQNESSLAFDDHRLRPSHPL